MTSAALPRALFRQLQGQWKLDRTLKSTNASEPSGKCYGTARFTPRPVSPAPGQTADEEMLYQESGEFEIDMAPVAGFKIPRLTFSRMYIWRLSTGQDPGISVWFTKPGTEELDYLFHKLDFRSISGSSPDLNRVSMRAYGSHLCVEDQYETEYQYDINPGSPSEAPGMLLSQWRTIHTVEGPKKDQLITTTFIKGP